MDAKDLRTESALSERNNDGSKYSQSGGIALHCDRNKSYQDIGSNSLAKVDVQNTRPCAVIGPDRVVPPSVPNDAYMKKGPAEPWPCMDNAYHTRRPPEYPHKLTNFQNPTRNISPRQTFQENMQRIMVPPSYNSVKISDDTNYVQISDRSNALSKNIKINVPPEAKFCDVPYTVYPNNNEQKNVRNAEMCISNVNPTIARSAPHGWPPGSVNIRPSRTYGAPELYQYQEYPSCAGPRPVVPRPNRTVPEEPGYVYADAFYHQEGNVRFKPYPTVKDRFPQQRYEYIGNYPNSFHPPPNFPSHKYELQKTVPPPHPYPPYPPIKYIDRVSEPVMEGYQRNQQGNYNMPYRNQIIHPNYGSVIGNCPQNKLHSYPPDAHIKTLGPNNTKAYIEYENGRPKMFPPSESFLVNEMGRVHTMKNQVIMPNYPTINMHNIPPNPYYKKDHHAMKNYEYLHHFRNMDPNLNIHNPMIRHPSVFSPNTSAISPTDSSASNDTSQTLGASQEDCGYVSQSSTASARSVDSGINRIPNDYLRKYYDSRYGPIIRAAPMMSKSHLNANHNSKEKKNIDVRQFLQMWNEGDEEAEENNAKEIIIQSGSKSDNNFLKSHEVINQPNQEQLYVLGLVNVPSEELGKYEHIQKVSKLPENIKGYNHLELLNQFEEAIESSNMSNYKPPASKDFPITSKVIPPKHITGVIPPPRPPRALSPLDVEAKISQSVIHKEVGCNFEIKPCSPKMLNVEVATPVQNILAERAIEKVANPVMLKSPRINGLDDNVDCNIMKRKEHRININNEPVRIPSCKMINTQFSNNNSIDSIKNSYSLQDLESNSGLCLASLPRLDNDIELNFPEVNQQFINATKGDSSVSTSLRDLPSLELLDQSDNRSNDKLDDITTLNQVNDVLKSPCIIDSEKEFSKLSKFRKTKMNSSDSKENPTHVTSVINAARTDSVIIKNPENAKKYEDKNIFSPNCLNKQVCDIQQVPINLTSQENVIENSNTNPTNIEPSEINPFKENTAPVEIAIDFSLNKTSSNENVESIDIENTKDVEILTQSSIEENHSLLGDHLNRLPTFSHCNENTPDSFIDNTDNKVNESTISSPIKYNDSETVSQNLKDKDILRQIENSTLDDDSFLKDKLLPSGLEEVEDDMSTSLTSVLSGPSENHITNDIGDSLLPIEFVTPAAEFLPTDRASDCSMNLDNHNDIVETHSQEAKKSLSENDLDSINIRTGDECKLHCKEEDNTINTNIKVKANTDDVFEVVNTKQINSELNTKTSDVNVNQTIDSSVVEDPKNIYCCNFDLTNKDILDRNTCTLNSTKQSTDAQLDLSSPSNIVTPNLDDQCTEADDQKMELSSLNYIVTQNSIDLKSETTEGDTESFSPAPKSPNQYLPDESEQGSSSNLILLNLEDSVMDRNEDDQPKISETDIEFSSSPPANITNEVPYIYQSDVAKEALSNINSLPNNTQLSNKEQADDSRHKSISNLNLMPPSDVTASETTDEISTNNESISLLHNLSPKEHSQDVLVKDVEDISVTSSIINLPVEKEDKHIDLKTRYLSYGSKEMYSPWIQKLVMFCEGNITIENNRVENSHIEIETEQSEIPNDFVRGHKDDEMDTNHLDRKVDSTSSIVEKATTVRSDLSVIKEDTNYNTNKPCENDCISTGDSNYNAIELTEINSTSKLHEENSLFPIENTHINCQNLQNNIAISSSGPIINDVENDNTKQDTLSDCNEVSRFPSLEINERWDSQSNCSDRCLEEWENNSNCSNDILEECRSQSECVDVHKELDKQSGQYDVVPNQWDKQSDYLNKDVRTPLDNQSNQSTGGIPNPCETTSNCNDEEQSDKEFNCDDNVPEQWDKQSDSSDNETVQWNEQSKHSDDQSKQLNENPDCNDKSANQCDNEINRNEEIFVKSDGLSNCTNEEINLTTKIESEDISCNKLQTNEDIFLNKKRQPLKRSLSDSALNIYNSKNEHLQQESEENVQFVWPFKRRKITNNDILAQDLCNIIQNNRRNSISAIYNEENVSFCILIDNGCIITEEETDDHEKICYTELSDECLAEIQNECIKDEESMETMREVLPDISDSQQENDCDYSDSFIMQEENEKLEESWVEDVACVETVISDDIAADIEISEPTSPKDDMLSDNDESGVFSSSEHTDKVKYIYGDKMCNDDAQFVETLYNTPQMDVNKTLVQRETLISGDYYDNDSLEKILSESNDQDLSPYAPEYSGPVYSPAIVDVKETVENKENMVIEMVSTQQNKISALDIVDTGIDKDHHDHIKLCELFDETQDDTVHSCESSVDDVFTYKGNDGNSNYTSSSPEVSSTTSEEKKSAILLKITNYQGSRISHVNDINRDNKRPSCKFTEDKDYVQSQLNFSSHRPLLTKAAQKYIPPLKESIRDLKVKLSLPQHSLIKLKQLKKSKDEPKVCKQNTNIPRVSKKPKPKFEDVLKSLDEIQIKMHKEKSKKSKKAIPKVVIKKNENGSHYASTSSKEEFNPDLTGRKWQPWVFIEKNYFIDKMAMKKKTKAIYSHRKRTYVLAEKFQKYKSVNNAKFVISPPISDCPSAGLKYTIRLKHNY